MRFKTSVLAISILFGAATALAGPPLVCHPFDIGGAPSLPWIAGDNWENPEPAYDLSRLTGDTLSLLGPRTPVVVRMETMRRAAIYSIRNHDAGRELLRRLSDRRTSSPGAIADFDYGYFAATLKQLEWRYKEDLSNGVNGYEYVGKALAADPGNAGMHFAAALMADTTALANDRTAHLNKARSAASDTLLAANLRSHFR